MQLHWTENFVCGLEVSVDSRSRTTMTLEGRQRHSPQPPLTHNTHYTTWQNTYTCQGTRDCHQYPWYWERASQGGVTLGHIFLDLCTPTPFTPHPTQHNTSKTNADFTFVKYPRLEIYHIQAIKLVSYLLYSKSVFSSLNTTHVNTIGLTLTIYSHFSE